MNERNVRRSKGDKSNILTSKDSLDDRKKEKTTSSRKSGMRSTRNSTKGRASMETDHTNDEDERNVHCSNETSNKKSLTNDSLEETSIRNDVLICTIVNEETNTTTSKSKKRKAAKLQSHNEHKQNVPRSKRNTNKNRVTKTNKDSLDETGISAPVNNNTTNSLKESNKSVAGQKKYNPNERKTKLLSVPGHRFRI